MIKISPIDVIDYKIRKRSENGWTIALFWKNAEKLNLFFKDEENWNKREIIESWQYN